MNIKSLHICTTQSVHFVSISTDFLELHAQKNKQTIKQTKNQTNKLSNKQTIKRWQQ